MATTVAPVERQVVLSGITWETYERLLEEHEGKASPRFTYDHGELEIMVLSFEHEELNRLLHDLFTTIAVELGIDFLNAGSTTFKREDLAGGFEPDTSFYVENAPRVRGKKRLALPTDPPPDLVIEVDVTSSSLDKMDVYASVGVREVWRYNGTTFRIYVREGDAFTSREESLALSNLTQTIASRFLAEGKSEPRAAWIRRLRDWTYQQAK